MALLPFEARHVPRRTAHNYSRRKLGLLRITFGVIVFSLLLVSFLLGHNNTLSSKQDDSWLSENKNRQWEDDGRKEPLLLERKEEQHLVSETASSPQQWVGTVPSQEGSYQRPSNGTLDLVLFANYNSALEATDDMTTSSSTESYTLDGKQLNSDSNISMQDQATISLLKNPVSLMDNSVSLSNIKPSSVEVVETYHDETPFLKPEPSNLVKTRNISETQFNNSSYVDSLELVDWTNISSNYSENLQVALPSLESQGPSNLSFSSQNLNSFYENKLTLNHISSLKSNMEGTEVAKVNGCFDICSYAKHEVLSDVQVSSIVQHSPESDIHSVLLLFHGCKHSARDWFVLPEEVSVVCEALRRNFSVVAFSSVDRWSGCWDSFYPALGNKDVIRVHQSFQEWIFENFVNNQTNSQQAIQSLKLYALGVSSGGSFVSILSTFLRNISAQAIYISPGSFQSFTLFDWNPYPPTFFVHMLKDTTFGSFNHVNSSCNLLTQHKIACRILSLKPVPITADWFHEKIPIISLSLSRQLFDLLNTTRCSR
ncbi:uncharacterized protein Gasu_41910 [Galdieria sulphuraria]|uniref:Uncharacterized protein n=1 Tax=Galdieria sulphuraria TaxID=130081 RepID=M2XEH3_GALSU|nr:uncharacterized protein Gasu_41910 [Galdieria sulphuraria]EME28352.1 hypothetical protein Gasu_41910 [Galdieria sulphuraria]|eukprot:XP_005704872.1 hypothetical protein Gasu_41910 [Galdieria sulphuraria]